MPIPSLPRLQLFEFNDEAWAGAAVRDSLVESLSRTLSWGRMLRGLVPPFREFLAQCDATEVLDLCSGAGGPAAILADEIAETGATPPLFVLTDLYPRPDAWRRIRADHPSSIAFHPDPVDATEIAPELSAGRARVVINAFHHFPPALATKILQACVRDRAPIFIAEGLRRNPLSVLSLAPVGVLAILANPVLSPDPSPKKTALTWLSPAMLAVGAWDGLVSTLRIYTEAELRRMVAPLGGGYEWVYGSYRYAPFGRGTYFYGLPPRARTD